MEKPYPEFPLTPHRNGQWCKKIQGKLYYFGTLANWQAALSRYLEDVNYLQLGKTPPGSGDRLADVLNLAIDDKASLLASGEISSHHHRNFVNSAKRVMKAAGDSAKLDMGPQAWAEVRATLAARYSPTTVDLDVSLVNVMVQHAKEMGHIEALPNMGPLWKGPSARKIREHLARKNRVVTREEFATITNTADRVTLACVMLGANCAFGPADLSKVSQECFSGDECKLVRSKTGTFRHAILWPETRKLVDVFPLGMTPPRITNILNRHLKQIGHSSYDLRHTFGTIGDQFADSRAVDVVMGHSDGSVRSTYRHGVEVERIRRVCEFVRERLIDLGSALVQRSEK